MCNHQPNELQNQEEGDGKNSVQSYGMNVCNVQSTRLCDVIRDISVRELFFIGFEFG